jgi:predicted transcriptional regulator
MNKSYSIIDMKFPEETDIKRMRKNLDITQAELATISGVSQSTIAKMERGAIKGSYEAVTRIFTVLEEEMNRRSHSRQAKDVMSEKVISVQVRDTTRHASEIMRQTGYSQLPVFDGVQHVGSITEYDILSRLQDGARMEDLSELGVGSIMSGTFPIVNVDTPVDVVTSLLSTTDAVLVSKKGMIVGIITRSDVLKLM